MVEIRFKPSDVGTVPDGSVTTVKLADDAVTAPKILDGEVIEVKLGDGAVSSRALAALAVVIGKLADGAVDKTKIKANEVVLADAGTGDKKVLKMGYDSVTEEVVMDVEA